MDKNYQFFMKTTNLDSCYVGQWIAICDQKIVSFGTDVKKVFEEAKKQCPNGRRPLMARVPDAETMIV